MHIMIDLDMKAIELLHLKINSSTVKESIVAVTKLNIEPDKIFLCSTEQLLVFPKSNQITDIAFEIQKLEIGLPKVILLKN